MSHVREWKHPWQAEGDVGRLSRHGKPVPAGPWDNEPDKVQWIDDTTGLDCLIHRGPLGAWCGYVGVPEGHPFFGKNYSDLYDDSDFEIRVHGGLTYASFCQDTTDESVGVCHVPEPGRPHRVWWLGFDCGHGGDLIPGMLPLEAFLREQHPSLGRMPFPFEQSYKDRAYVEQEVRSLAQQLADAKG